MNPEMEIGNTNNGRDRVVPAGISAQNTDRMPSIESLNAGELNIAASILAESFSLDPVYVWATRRYTGQLIGAASHFMSALRNLLSQNLEIFVTTDHTAVAVITFHKESDPEPKARANKVQPSPTRSTVNDFFEWIQTFRPGVAHYSLEFIGCRPGVQSRGRGSFLLNSLLKSGNEKRLPLWSWSSNPRNLNFYRLLGFEISEELRFRVDTPPVALLWHPPSPSE